MLILPCCLCLKMTRLPFGACPPLENLTLVLTRISSQDDDYPFPRLSYRKDKHMLLIPLKLHTNLHFQGFIFANQICYAIVFIKLSFFNYEVERKPILYFFHNEFLSPACPSSLPSLICQTEGHVSYFYYVHSALVDDIEFWCCWFL